MRNMKYDEKKFFEIEKEQLELIKQFESTLVGHLSPKTIKRYIRNIEMYVNDYMLWRANMTYEHGYDEISMFMSFFYIRKRFASKDDINKMCASVKKFYSFLVQLGKISQEDYEDLAYTIKFCKDEWIEETKY